MVLPAAQTAEPRIVPEAAKTGIPLELASRLADYRQNPNLSIKFERLPPGARLSRGRNTGDGTWSLPGDELDGVFYLPPNGIAAPATLTLRVISTHRDEATVLTAFDLEVGKETSSEEPTSEEPRSEERPAPEQSAEASAATAPELVEPAVPAKTGVDKETLTLLSKAREAWRDKCERRAAEVAALSKAEMEAFMTERARRLGDAVARAEAADLALGEARAKVEALTKRVDEADAEARARDQAKSRTEGELETERRAREQAEQARGQAEQEIARLGKELAAREAAHTKALEEAHRAGEEAAGQRHAATIAELEKRQDEELAAQADAIVARLKAEFMDQMERARTDWQRESTVSIEQVMERAERAERDLAATQARARELEQTQGTAAVAAPEPVGATGASDPEAAPEAAPEAPTPEPAAAEPIAPDTAEPDADAERPEWERELEARLAEARANAEADAERRLEDARAQWELETEAALAGAMESWRRDEAERLAKARERWQKNQSRKIVTRASKRGQKTEALRRFVRWGAIGLAVLVLAVSAPRLVAAFKRQFGPELTEIKTGARQLGSNSLALADQALRTIRTQLGADDRPVLASGVVNVETANLRAAPSTSAKLVGTLQRADGIAVMDKRGSWVLVRLIGVPNTEGWVHRSLLKVDPVTKATPAPGAAPSDRD